MKRTGFLFIAIMLFCLNSYSQSYIKKDKDMTVKVVGHSHMDVAYRWQWNEMENRELFSTFSKVLDVLDNHPELHYVQSYLLYYSTIQKRFPKLFNKVKQSIKENRWSVVGGQWVEPDESLPSGESLIRQFLIAHDYYSRNLGIENVSIAWSPDAFTGHLCTLPKIYAGCGIKNYVFSRESPLDKKIFWWESRDGSKILAYKIPGSYNPNYKKLPELIKNWSEIAGYNSAMVTVGKGDHGGGPCDNDFYALDSLYKKSNLKVEFISPEDYFKELRNSDNVWPVQMTEFGVQSLENQWWSGCYTSQAKIKKLNRYYENKLITAEKFSAIGTMHKGKPFYPREDFLKAWEILLFNQFHDIIPGTLADLGVNDVYEDYNRLGQITSELLNYGLENIGNRINTSEMEGIPLVVYNPHSWAVRQFVEARIKFIKKTHSFYLKDSAGKNIPYSVINKSDDELEYKILINDETIPAMGYKVFEVIEGADEKVKSDLKASDNCIENNYYIIKWNSDGIFSIFSKKIDKEILKENSDRLQLLEDNGSSWGFKLTGKEFLVKSLKNPEIVFRSPLKVVVQWEDYYQSSKFIRQMIVNANSVQIDFNMDVDWHSRNKFLKVVFNTNVEKGKAFYDQPYGYVQRDETGKDVPAQEWIDYSSSDYGVSLLNNGKYGFSMKDGKLSMSVVRGPGDMDPRMDEGKHSFKYALIVHDGDWRNADIPLRARELNQPLIAKQEIQHSGKISGWKYTDLSFPQEQSFFSINSDHVIISSLKTKQDAYDANPLILRILETEGRDDSVTVNLPYDVKSVKECNHLEEEIKSRSEIETGNKRFSFKIGHDQIRTFKIKF